MHPESKIRAITGLVAVVAGVALIGTSGAAFVAGWALWAVGLGVLLTALPSVGDERRRPASVTPLPSAMIAAGDRRAA